jgi:hypothetical protein
VCDPLLLAIRKKEKKRKTSLSSYGYIRKLKDSQMEDVGGVVLEFNGVDDQ